ncbi:MAG: NAD-dependent protein deacylase [Clostridia bacterium]|nr:NAD-dependent protein deacylase [Clostridia bacterium]
MDEKLKKDIETLRGMLKDSEYAVFFGGAGVSTESGIPDFRGAGGLYTSDGKGNEYYLSRRCLTVDPFAFYRFFNENMIFPEARPNNAHYALAKLESEGKLKAVITQNIDGLHQEAGSKRVLELHGTVSRSYCMRCGKVCRPDMSDDEPVPKCPACGGIVRPDVTLYGEPLDGFTFREAEEEIARADLLIAGGSSLTVYPAASLVGNFEGGKLVIINYSPTPYDDSADLVIRASLGEVLSAALSKEDE